MIWTSTAGKESTVQGITAVAIVKCSQGCTLGSGVSWHCSRYYRNELFCSRETSADMLVCVWGAGGRRKVVALTGDSSAESGANELHVLLSRQCDVLPPHIRRRHST